MQPRPLAVCSDAKAQLGLPCNSSRPCRNSSCLALLSLLSFFSSQDLDLRPLADGNIVDLVMSMHALHMHPPAGVALRLQVWPRGGL
jgi:hypothetical protein